MKISSSRSSMAEEEKPRRMAIKQVKTPCKRKAK
jgi:hypothetical protein